MNSWWNNKRFLSKHLTIFNKTILLGSKFFFHSSCRELHEPALVSPSTYTNRQIPSAYEQADNQEKDIV